MTRMKRGRVARDIEASTDLPFLRAAHGVLPPWERPRNVELDSGLLVSTRNPHDCDAFKETNPSRSEVRA